MKAYQNLYITGSINVTGSGITGSLYGTASYTETASYVNILTQPVTISGSVQISGSLLINGEEPGTGGGTTVTISGSAPSGSATGSLWFNNDDLNLYVQYYDGTSSYWVPSYNNQSLYANSASFAATASLANNAITASYAASLTGSLRQDLTLSGSILISGSLLVNGSPAGAGGGATVTITGSAPSGSKDSGSLWWNETDGNLYIQVTGPTGSTYVPATNTVAGGNYGATYTFAGTGSTWNVNHNLNTLTPLITVYSGSSVMIPATITSLDANNTRITFSGSVPGTAILSTGIGNATTNNAVSASFATSASYAVRAGQMFDSAVTITGTTSAPTKGSTRTVDRIILVDDGSGLCTVTMNYYQSNAGTAGSGDYLFTLPAGYQFDTSFHSAYAVAGDPNLSGNESWIPGSSGKITAVAANLMANAFAQVWDATRFRILEGSEILYGSNINYRTPVGSAFYSLNSSGTGFQMTFTFKKA